MYIKTSKELQILRVLDDIVLDLKEKEDYDIIKKLYEGLLEEGIIQPMEDIENRKIPINSIEGHLLYRFLLAARKSWLKERYVTPDAIGEQFEEGYF